MPVRTHTSVPSDESPANTSAAQHQQPPPKLGLMSLPREIRDKILRSWLKFDAPISQFELHDVAATRAFKAPLTLCKQLRSEGLHVFYEENVFCFHVWDYGYAVPPWQARRRIRHLRLVLRARGMRLASIDLPLREFNFVHLASMQLRFDWTTPLARRPVSAARRARIVDAVAGRLGKMHVFARAFAVDGLSAEEKESVEAAVGLRSG